MHATIAQSTSSAPSVAAAAAPVASKIRRRISYVMTGLASLFLVFDAAMKLIKVAPVVEGMQRVGYPDGTARPLGLVLLACVVVHLVPRTAVLGAVLLTGYLGGAIATHVRIEDPLFSHTLFPVYFGALIWGALYLRDPRVRALAPWST